MKTKRLGYVYFSDGRKEGVTYWYIPEKLTGCFEFHTCSGKYLYTVCTCKHVNKPVKKLRRFVKYEQVCNHGIHERFYTVDIDCIHIKVCGLEATFSKTLCAIAKGGRIIYLE